MIVKQSGGRIFGAVLNKKEQEALDIEIKHQLADIDRKNMNEIDAMILWLLHEEFGFGKKRLKRVHDAFTQKINGLIRKYELDDSETPWVCTKKLKEYGIDIEQWNKQGE